MTTTHTVAAMLSVAVAALEAQNKAHKAETGEALFSLNQDLGNGVTFREIKAWAKDFKAKQAAVVPPKSATVKTPTEKAPAVPAEVVELKGTEVTGQIVLIGRSKETATRIVRDKTIDARVVITDKGTRVRLADIERNNRGNLRLKLDAAPLEAKTTVKPAVKTPAAKAPTDFEPETTARKFPVRVLAFAKPSSNIVGATYDRNTHTLTVTFKDGNVYNYDDVKLSEVRAFETAESAGKWFAANIKGVKTFKAVSKSGKTATTAKVSEKAPAATVKPATKASVKPAADAVEFTSNELRGSVMLIGRKSETIAKVVKDTTGARVAVTEEGTRAPVSSLRKNNRGKFVFEAAQVKPATKAAEKAPTAPVKAENTRKVTANGNKKADFAKAEAAPKKMHVVEARPTITDVKEGKVRVVKGSKETLVPIERVVRREGTRYAITENRFPLPFDQIIFMDGQLTYTGRISAEEYRAL